MEQLCFCGFFNYDEVRKAFERAKEFSKDWDNFYKPQKREDIRKNLHNLEGLLKVLKGNPDSVKLLKVEFGETYEEAYNFVYMAFCLNRMYDTLARIHEGKERRELVVKIEGGFWSAEVETVSRG